MKTEREKTVRIRAGNATIEGNLAIPVGAKGIVLFAHGSGSSRFSPRNQYVARVLREGGVGTLLFDLLEQSYREADARTWRWTICRMSLRRPSSSSVATTGRSFR